MSSNKTTAFQYAFYGMSLVQLFDSLRYQRSVILVLVPNGEQKSPLLAKLGVGMSLQGTTVEWIHTMIRDTHNTWDWMFGLYDPNAIFGVHRLWGYLDGSTARGVLMPSEN